MIIPFLIVGVLGLFQEEPPTMAELLAKANEAFAVQDYPAAVEHYRQVIRSDPHNVKALHALARLYTTASDPDFFDGKLAVELALMALDETPNDPEIIDTLALGYFAQNKFERSIREYERACVLNPYEPYYYRQMKKVATTWKARLDMMQPGRDGEEKARAGFYAGKARYHLGEMPEALEALEYAYRIGGARSDSCLYLARVTVALGDSDRAMEVMKSLGESAASHAELQAVWGEACFEAGDIDGSLEHYERAHDLDPEIPGLRTKLGRAYLQAGKSVKAAMILKEAFELVDRNGLFARKRKAEILFLMGQALVEADAGQMAMSRMLEALTLTLDLPDAERTLTELYIEQAGSERGLWAHLDGLSGGGAVSFTEASGALGIDITGCPAFGDYDRDGDPDLLLSGSLLFENTVRNGFVEVTKKAGLENAPLGGGVFGDMNNDGSLDIYVTEPRKGYRDRLFLNSSRHGFKEMPEGEGHPSDLFPTLSVALGDVNEDGYLDVYLANGLRSQDEMERNQPDNLYLSTGSGQFENATQSSGIGRLPPLCSVSANMTDFDNDGDLDIYVAHDYLAPNRLWLNDGRGNFTEVARARHAAGVENDGRFGNSQAASFGDVDNDGDLDLFLTNRAEPRFIPFSDKSMLLINSGRPAFEFTDHIAASGVLFEPEAYQSLFIDVNNDGLLDLFLFPGVKGEPARLYTAREDGTYSDITWLAGIRVDGVRGCAAADVDLDGDQDLFVGTKERPYLFLNNGCPNHWVGIRLQGLSCNATGIGARVIVDYGASSQSREIKAGHGAACQDDMVAHFGLGEYQGKVSVSIQWPDGKSSFVRGLKADKVHVVKGKK